MSSSSAVTTPYMLQYPQFADRGSNPELFRQRKAPHVPTQEHSGPGCVCRQHKACRNEYSDQLEFFLSSAPPPYSVTTSISRSVTGVATRSVFWISATR